MFEGLPLPVLIAVFAGAAAVVWMAGIRLSDTTDVLSTRLRLGSALGGLVLLAIATNLPEIAITASAALGGQLDIAVGNVLGGIAVQTVVLAVIDAVGVRGPRGLTYRAASLTLVLEAVVVVAVLMVVIMGTQLPDDLIALRVTPDGVGIVALWVAGIWLVARAGRGLPWHDEQGDAPDTQDQPKGGSKQRKTDQADRRQRSTSAVTLVFAAAAAATLFGGVVLEQAGEQIADAVGMTGVLFGATVLAAATALPEVSTGLTSVELGDDQLAMSDIFGGNAFLPVLFLLATLLSGEAVLPRAQATDIYLTALGVLLTAVYIVGLVFRPTRRVLGMGIDSLTVVVLYLVGVAGLFAIAAAT